MWAAVSNSSSPQLHLISDHGLNFHHQQFRSFESNYKTRKSMPCAPQDLSSIKTFTRRRQILRLDEYCVFAPWPMGRVSNPSSSCGIRLKLNPGESLLALIWEERTDCP